ncbi:MAG: Arm DNA-binding domain-containing protein [Sphingorhabdus sp.]
MMPLSVFAIQNAKPKAKPYKLTDFESLYLLVKPNGSKLWQMSYSYLGRQNTLSFGPFPRTTLAEARQKKDVAKKQLAAGLDPSEQKKLEQLHRVLSAENTFKAVAEEWFEKRVKEGLSEVTLSKIRWLLNMSYPTLVSRPARFPRQIFKIAAS